MRNGLAVLMASWGLALAGCAAPDPRPGPIRAMEPRPNPPVGAEVRQVAGGESASVQDRVRRNPWLARFWEELSPPQRRRAAAGMRRGAAGQEPAAARWDVMGLEERAALVFGGNPRRAAAGAATGATAGPAAAPAVAGGPAETVAAAPEPPAGPARPATP
jgi:hypothetical protein